MSLAEAVKIAAQDVVEAGKPTVFLFGAVTAVAPLTIRVDNRFEITGDAIVLLREFRAGAWATHTHTIPAHEHGDGTPVALTTEGESYPGLAQGDKVALLRNQGGQQFLVLGRV